MTENHSDIYGKEILPGIRLMRDGIFIFNPGADGPNDCPACRGGDAQHNAELIDESGALAYIDGHKLRIETFDIDGDPTDVSVKINYCPTCGRKLEEA